jgi:hypothetical protein
VTACFNSTLKMNSKFFSLILYWPTHPLPGRPTRIADVFGKHICQPPSLYHCQLLSHI